MHLAMHNLSIPRRPHQEDFGFDRDKEIGYWRIMNTQAVVIEEKSPFSPITYLRHALDIPYCHHERWDGSGYPQGLKGEQIPLAARIFAIIDVCDALSFIRPYRATWQKDKVVEYIRLRSGILFDPRVVELF